MLSRVRQPQTDTCYFNFLTWGTKLGEVMATKSKLLFARAWGGMWVKGTGFPGCRMLTLPRSSAQHSNSFRCLQCAK